MSDSDIEIWKGRIRPSSAPGETLDDQLKFILAEGGCPYTEEMEEEMSVRDYFDEIAGDYFDEIAGDYFDEIAGDDFLRGKYVVILDTLYEYEELEEIDSEDFQIFTKNEDGSIDFMVGYWNGGTTLRETLELVV